jgi:hypothetical protein
LRIEHAIANDEKLARAALADEHVPTGEKGYAEGAVERFRHHRHLDLVLLGSIENEWTVTQGSAWEIDHVGLTEESGAKCGDGDESTYHRFNIRAVVGASA